MLEIVQIIFFTISTIGVIIATFNHFLFVRDRNTQTLIALTDFFNTANEKFIFALKEDRETHVPAVSYLNAVTIYCHMHNHNQLRAKTKVVHERYVAGRLSYISEKNLLRKTNESLKAFSASGYKEINTFITNNSEFFPNFKMVKDYFGDRVK